MGRAFEVRKESMMKTAAKKSKLYAKYGKEIYMAAKSGTPDLESNANLKRIIEKAKKDQVPADVIKRAIDKAKGGSDENYTEARYEGFGPGNSMFIVQTLTDNVNRSIAEVRNCFTKTQGKLGVSGSVVHQFVHRAVFVVPDLTEDEALEALIASDIDIEDIESSEQQVTIYGEASDFYKIKTVLNETYPDKEVSTEEIMFLPIAETTLTSEEELQKFEKLIQMLEELDDVQEVFHNVVI